MKAMTMAGLIRFVSLILIFSACRTPHSSNVGFDGHKQTFCLVTQHSSKPYDYIYTAIDSQQHYALLRGYAHQAFWGRVSGDAFSDPLRGDIDTLYGGGLYWQKIAAVQQMLASTVVNGTKTEPRCQWVMWLDSDVAITNENIRLENIVDQYAPPISQQNSNDSQIDVILSTEQYREVNAGVFMIRNTAFGRSYIDSVGSLYHEYKDHILPEQDAMTDLALLVVPWQIGTLTRGTMNNLHPSITIVPQRTFNSFPDMGRGLDESARWQPCDFTAHFAGVKRSERARGMNDILALAQECPSN